MRPRYLLLGNGFSIDLHPQFGYSSLVNEARAIDPDLAAVIDTRGGGDFEAAMRGLHEEALALHESGTAPGRVALREDIEAIKRLLVRVVHRVHPAASYSISQTQYAACAAFLSNFIGSGRGGSVAGRVFTTNYDLILYWTLVRHRELGGVDGFRNAGVPWDGSHPGDLTVFFLHGGLHLYRVGGDLQRLVSAKGGPVVDQVQARLERDEFPLFVAEGLSELKSARIWGSGYLKTARKTFSHAGKKLDVALFTVGHGLGEQDHHLTNLIGYGWVRTVFIGAYKGLRSSDGERAAALARQWQCSRSEAGRPPVEVIVFDSRECSIWRREHNSLGAIA